MEKDKGVGVLYGVGGKEFGEEGADCGTEDNGLGFEGKG
ncbi:hypothetical protein AusDCA_3018 [Desulfitobacterium sp. AusDCA]